MFFKCLYLWFKVRYLIKLNFYKNVTTFIVKLKNYILYISNNKLTFKKLQFPLYLVRQV